MAFPLNNGNVSELHGKYYTQNFNGKLWSASITTATAIPVFATNPTPNFLIINPSNSGVNVVFARLHIGFSAGTGVAGTIGYAYVPGLRDTTVGTTSAMSAITVAATMKTGFVGQPYGGQTVFATAATLLGTAPYVPVIQRWSNLSQGAVLTSTAAMYNLYEDFDGTLILPPGGNIFLTASVAIAETNEISLIAYETPITG